MIVEMKSTLLQWILFNDFRFWQFYKKFSEMTYDLSIRLLGKLVSNESIKT